MTSAAAPPATVATSTLRRLYLVRSAFALAWAAALSATASSLGPVSGALLVLYPLVDVAAAVVDARASRSGRPALGPYVNIAVSALAAIGLAVAVASGVPAVLRVWGIWAVLAGLVQLAAAVVRRGVGGQWPLIASGAMSAVAGTSFWLQAGGDASLVYLAGYALLGGVFFAVSAWRLGRATARG